MMVVDDLGWTDVGYHGGKWPTPTIDKLAADGVKLNKYYVQQVCSPTRSALLTARYPFRTGMQHSTTLAPGTSAKIPTDTATIAEVLKNVGYSTHAIGKCGPNPRVLVMLPRCLCTTAAAP
jgi:arylsulfatase A-like enzyme